MILREVQKEDKKEILEIYNEYLNSELIPGIDRFEGIRNFQNLSNLSFEEWLEELKKYKDETKLPENFSPQTTYLAIENNHIVGLINIRWKAVPVLLSKGGFIGYGIRPTERGKGYGNEMLRLALNLISKDKFKKVLVTCKDFNNASKKVIENNNGIFENTYYDEESKCKYLRYWINIE